MPFGIALKSVGRALSGKLPSLRSVRTTSGKSVKLEIDEEVPAAGSSSSGPAQSAAAGQARHINRRAALEAAARTGSARALAQLAKEPSTPPSIAEGDRVLTGDGRRGRVLKRDGVRLRVGYSQTVKVLE
jgi:hypothetical protein